MNVDRVRLEYAAEVFLNRMSAANPAAPRRLADYPPQQRAQFLAALEAAIKAAADTFVTDSFVNWLAQRESA